MQRVPRTSLVDLYQQRFRELAEGSGRFFSRKGEQRMSKSHLFSLVGVAVAASSVAFSAHAQTCAAGYTLHPRFHLCVAKPACAEGSTLHPRLHLCVAEPTCATGKWHPRLHRCVGT